MIARHWKGPAPLCVNGRMFVVGQYSLMAVDAYNGRALWRRDLPQVGRFPASSAGSNVVADEDSVYAATGNTCLRLNGGTGQTLHTYKLPRADADLEDHRIKSPVWSYLSVGRQGILGSAGTVREADYLFLLSKAGDLKWTYAAEGTVGSHAISMDDGRVYLIDQTSPARIARAKRLGEHLSANCRLVALDAATGKVAWETDAGIGGRTELWLADGVLVATGSGGMSGYEASTGKSLYNRQVAMRRFPVIVGDTIYGEPAAYDLHTGEPLLRKDPFTAAETPWSFSRSYGCGSVSACPNLLLFRSGTLGMCDLAGDSGIHNFGGVRAGCHVNAIVAGGLVLMPPGDASRTCSYCFQTTIALAPARKAENWSVFYNRLPSTPVRRVALNLGSPGDQRDSEGHLWLAVPRPETAGRREDIAVPFRFSGQQAYGPYRVNADDVRIAGTDRPWLYSSGLRGPLRGAGPEHSGSGDQLLACRSGPEARWQNGRPLLGRLQGGCPAGWEGSVTLRHDEQNLYLAYRRAAATDSTGQITSWKKSTADRTRLSGRTIPSKCS